MKTLPLVGLALGLLAGCSSNSAVTSTGAGTTGTSTTSGTTSGTPVGTHCTPTAVVDVCALGGLVCDQVTSRCRLPALGEQCEPDVGCAPTPQGLGCHVTDDNGTAVNLCLITCTDSTSCPYGMTCVDNGNSYCTAQATGNCVPGAACSLDGVPGQCLTDGPHAVCYALGDQDLRYGPCNPYALNSDSQGLCAAGFICRAFPSTLGGFADAGFCFPFCGKGCPADEHCFQPTGAFYDICRPGISCEIDLDTCPSPESVCVPDDARSLNGGCLPTIADAGGTGDPCELSVGVPQDYPCQHGACLPDDAGLQCTPLCNRQSGGKPYCNQDTSCGPLSSDASAYDIVGACR